MRSKFRTFHFNDEIHNLVVDTVNFYLQKTELNFTKSVHLSYCCKNQISIVF